MSITTATILGEMATYKEEYDKRFELYVSLYVESVILLVDRCALESTKKHLTDERTAEFPNTRISHVIKEVCDTTFSKIPPLDADMMSSNCLIIASLKRWVQRWCREFLPIIRKRFDTLCKEGGGFPIDIDMEQIHCFIKSTFKDAPEDCNFGYLRMILEEYILTHEKIITDDEKKRENAESELVRDSLLKEGINDAPPASVPKSKSQLKKEKVREANRRREQEKADKKKRAEKEAKYLEQKRKEAERKRIAVCRAKKR